LTIPQPGDGYSLGHHEELPAYSTLFTMVSIDFLLDEKFAYVAKIVGKQFVTRFTFLGKLQEEIKY